MVALYILIAYLTVGLPALFLLNGRTKRIEKKIMNASEKVQEIAVRGAGVYISPRVAVVITLLSLWIFWPVAIYGRIESNYKKSKARNEETR